jgi:osmotically-inducible protein OsmY
LLESVRSWFEHAAISSPCSIVSTSELLSGAVRRVRGVRAIATAIEVRCPSDKKTADDEIARRALDILAWDATVPRNAVKITVHDGRVTLSGDVNWQFEWRAAEDQVRKLTGVNAIINNIRIRPSVVYNWAEREAAERAAWSAAGVTAVQKSANNPSVMIVRHYLFFDTSFVSLMNRDNCCVRSRSNGIAFSALGFPQFAETNPQNARPVKLGTLGGPVSSRMHRRKPV